MLKRMIRPLIRLIKRLRGPVSRGLTAIGDVLRQIPGMRGIIARIEDAMRRMMRYVDEFEASRTTPNIENLFEANAARGPMTAQGASMLPTDRESTARRETREAGTCASTPGDRSSL